MTVGERIKQRREELNMSQGDLATKMGVSRQAVSKAELHDNNITTAKVRKFAQALDCTEAYLMGWKEEESQPSEEQLLLDTYRELDEESKRQLVLMLAFLKDQNNKK